MTTSVLAAVAFALVAFGLVSQAAERSPVTPPMIFIALGLLLGDAGLGWLSLEMSAGPIHFLAELTLVLVLFVDAARIDLDCLRREESLPFRMLVIGLPLTLALGTGVGLLILPELGLLHLVLLAAILAPTDAALGQAVVSSPLLPRRIRQTLNVESGLNDGIVLPAVLIAAALASPMAGMGAEHAASEAPSTFAWLEFVALQLTLGPLMGVVVGGLGARVLGHATTSGWINPAFQRLSGVGLALLAFTSAELVGGNGFIAAFAGGIALGAHSRQLCECLFEFGEAEGQLLTLIVFLLFGAALVPRALEHVGFADVLYALASLTVVRMLPVAVSLLGTGLQPMSLAFLGWFGPRGLASILFVLLVVEEHSLPHAERVESLTMLVVLMSAFAHGATAFPFAKAYAARLGDADGGAAEHAAVAEQRVRLPHA